MRISAIIPAAGVGKRMQADMKCDLPKQFLSFQGTTILGAVLRALYASPLVSEIIIACAQEYVSLIDEGISDEQKSAKKITFVSGGEERADSVYNCLQHVQGSATHVLVQDAVRPFLTAQLIADMGDCLSQTDDGIIAARPVVPTLKKVDDGRILETVDRAPLWEAETPQLFKKEVLMEAYRTQRETGREERCFFTDEASLVEACGGTVRVFHVRQANIKITTEADYYLAKKMGDRAMMRVGIGNDIHRLVTGRPLVVGGLEIPFEKGCLGHSDGDPLLHAIVDALLGAAGLGDIGQYFPDTDVAHKGSDSKKILAEVVAKVRAEGFSVVNLDTTIIVERPKMAPLKKEMAAVIAGILGVSQEQVNVKAKTNEGLDSIGAADAIATQAVVLLEKKG